MSDETVTEMSGGVASTPETGLALGIGSEEQVPESRPARHFPRITRTRWQLVRWHLKCAWLHALGRLR